MNKKEKIAFHKRELSDLDIQEEITKQFLSGITSRKNYLKSELEGLGASNSSRKGKFDGVLSKKMELQLTAGMTNKN